MKVAAAAFKAYDIRGIVGEAIDEAFAEHLGRAFGSAAVQAGERAVAVGRDGRISGPALAAALARGLASTGLDVVDLGAVTTPMLYYVAATRGRHGCASGIQVTGSHNPKNYNGFKMVLAGRAIHGDEIQALRRRVETEDYVQGSGRIAAAGSATRSTAAANSGTCRATRARAAPPSSASRAQSPSASASNSAASAGQRSIQPGRASRNGCGHASAWPSVTAVAAPSRSSSGPTNSSPPTYSTRGCAGPGAVTDSTPSWLAP